MAKNYLNPFKNKAETKERKLRPAIVWGIPCDELSFSKFWLRFVATAGIMPYDGFAFVEGTYLMKARNQIHNAFLESKADYLMMLDSDILFPPNLLGNLMNHNLPIVGGWYRDKNSETHNPVVYDYVNDENGIANFRHRKEAGQGVERVDAMGAGCWLMTRKVAEALGKEPYGTVISGGGEDMILCRKLIDLKIPLHVDWSIACAHLGVGHW